MAEDGNINRIRPNNTCSKMPFKTRLAGTSMRNSITAQAKDLVLRQTV